VIGSHCVGQDYLLGRLQERGFHCKFLAVGSTGGLEAARRGECDMAGIHLMDPQSGVYNRPFLTPDLELMPGYQRLQGIVFRLGDPRFEGRSAEEAVTAARADADCIMVNRNRGSGTRILIDRLLAGAHPVGYFAEARSHNAVVAAVQQGRADWGVAIETVARDAGLSFLPLQEEHYDWVIAITRKARPAVLAFQQLLGKEETRNALIAMGFRFAS
jgi:putative molybdopterin biosynthesis protein